MGNIDDWRAEIDAIDEQLVRLLNERARLAIEIGVLKRAIGLPIHDHERERRVIARVCQINRGPLDEAAMIKIFKRIIRESRRTAIQRVAADEAHRETVR
ncbi:chorismate mutase [Pyrinomonas methylaliphatogenes]|jgi:chorismate mutase|uniref:chorismate mutase n=1 Tax=Pyrinomonas methylaliphatogenes TaxID=454194 RepID=A0A0B6WWE9_9BACT|nr:chorismate mutase [Pyrinomonas methylaliphatogenes]MBX5479070.1 chorismate mutase [Pyrinomonas methylaliphatogenes]CDM65583.1 chorismate mutase [Pyrinomonas methylaliphatogenes]